jgi:leucyl-tRNA synthetase
MVDPEIDAVQQRWLAVWDGLDPFRARDDGAAPRRYVLPMFSYPSGDLHMGHGEAYPIADAIARHLRLHGYDVLQPVGWDAFGLPAENAAIRRGLDPAAWTRANIATQAASYRRYAIGFDWSRRLETCDPSYYRWNQWLFLRLYERGLAYRAAAPVNWCPSCATVLANEQVVAGHCDHCHGPVTRRHLTQWFFRTTAYAQRLLDGMADLASRDGRDGWPESVLAMQRHWIGRSEGATIDFTVDGRTVTVFTTRPETVPAATALVLAPDGELADELCAPERRDALAAYRSGIAGTGDVARATDRSGVFLGRHAVNPATGDRIPVWAASYVLSDYGTGAIMAVPAADDRDAAFAAAHDLPVPPLPASAPASASASANTDAGANTDANTDAGAGADAGPARSAVVDRLVAAGVARTEVRYRLRDWLVSRQRYWGTPIPIVHCGECGEVPVPEAELPVALPPLTGEQLRGGTGAPLARARDWVEVPCPRCGGPAERDTDTMDTFVDSSWYHLRFCSPGYTDGPFDPAAVARWCPVDHYVGGIEHATGHLLFARFVTMVLHDAGLIGFAEPFRHVINQGQVVNEGRSMSKSLGNGVALGEQIDTYGVDAVRLTMLFAGPPGDDIDWADVSPAGSARFLSRALRLATGAAAAPSTVDAGDPGLRRATHRTIVAVDGLLSAYRFNVAIARLMELTAAARRVDPRDPAVREAAEALAVMLSVVAPYTAEEMWCRLGHPPTVLAAGWPSADPALSTVDTVECVVQVAGRRRAVLAVPADVDEATVTERALSDEAVRRALAGRPVARVVARPPRIVNIVPS